MNQLGTIVETSHLSMPDRKPRFAGALRMGLVVGSQGLTSVANLATSLFLIMVLGISEFGVYAIYFSIAFGMSAVVNALISSPLVSIASQKSPGVRSRMIASASVAIAVVSAAPLVLSLAADLLFGRLWGHGSLLVVVFCVFCTGSEFVRRAYFLQGRLANVWGFDVLRYGLQFGAFALSLRLGSDASTEHYVLLMAGANAVALAGVIVANAPALASRWRPRAMRCHVAHFTRAGRWLSMSSLLQFAGDQALLLVAAFMIGSFGAGVIRTCQTIVGIVNPVLTALEHMLPKKLGEDIRHRGRAHASAAYRRMALLVLLALAAVLGLVAIFASVILDIVSGGELRGYESLLRLYCALWFLYPASLMLSFAFRARNQALPVLASQSLAAAFTLALGTPLISTLGPYGVAVSTILAQAIAIAALVFLMYRDAAQRSGGSAR